MLKRLALTCLVALALAPAALASGGNYVFAGGTRAEQAQVKAALDASSFDFSLVPGPVTIHITRSAGSYATPGSVWLDAGLLDAGRPSWGVVQHEYGHQVDFALLNDTQRTQLESLLGGTSWCSGASHDQLTCERFADLIAWAYWQSPDNVMKPAGSSDEGGQVSPAAFRAALGQILGVRSLASVSTKPPPRKR